MELLAIGRPPRPVGWRAIADPENTAFGGRMQPRGQLWFALEALCRDFRECSGLGEKEALELICIILTNMLAEQRAQLDLLIAQAISPGGPAQLSGYPGASPTKDR
jgi:hypothetical protein